MARKPTSKKVYETPPSTPQAVRGGLQTVPSTAPPRVRFSWGRRHRQVVRLMFEDFRFDWHLIHRIFNELFKEECVACGMPHGLERRTINIQYHDRVKPSSKGWQQAEFLNKAEREGVIRDIQRVHERLSGGNEQVPPRTPTSRPAQPLTTASNGNVQRRVRNSPAVVITVPARKQVDRGSRGVFQRCPLITRDTTRILSGREVPLVTPDSPNMTDFLLEKGPISAEEAHPSIPSVLFRFYDENSQGRNGIDGFIAGWCNKLTTGFPPPPEYSDPYMFTLVETHFHKHPIASPFISTTSNLFFALRIATKSNAQRRRISILRGDIVAAGKQAFYADPYHKRLKDLKAYVDGVWRNAALHEYLVWSRIPSSAVMCDFSLEDLQRQLSRLPRMRAALRLDTMLATKIGSNKTIQDGFKQEPVALTDVLTRELAKLLLAFNVDASTNPSITAKLIGEFVRGWAIVIDRDYRARWDLLAGFFAYTLTKNYPELPESRLDTVKEAFLSGLESGLGPQNWHLDAKKTGQMRRKAASKGLGAELRVGAGLARRAIRATPRPATDGFVDLVGDDVVVVAGDPRARRNRGRAGGDADRRVERGHGRVVFPMRVGVDDPMDGDYLDADAEEEEDDDDDDDDGMVGD